MNTRYIYILLLLLLANSMWSCSTKKNTWATRSYHQTKTKYNIYYNGAISFQEGEDAIREANKDDYSGVLNLYAVSNHDAAEASKSQMERTIEKCRKCIKLHSIKTRPKVDHEKKRKNSKYAAWLEQEEFNNQIANAWILLGMAEFHKGDFLGSVSTFNYIARHYAYDPDVVAQCQLWIVRAYAEMGWYYEAEDVLSKVQVDNLSRKHAPLYSSVSADLLIKTKRYREAIPFVKIALPNESKHGNRPRFQYVLAQLYQLNDERELARHAYKKVLKMQPSNEMDFNARLNIAELESSPQDAIKLLKKMVRLDKHKDQLDQIYGTIGNVYLAQKDTVNALENYEQGIAESTQQGSAKAKILITAGDIYYEQRNYIKASPCYKEAAQILSAESEQYQRIQQRSETLDELVVEHSMVLLQDSLQRLAGLSIEEQRVVVDSIIARLIRAEEAEKERAAQAAREAENSSAPRSVNTSNMIGGGSNSRDWYFYNSQLLQAGKQIFRTQWGNRILEDNWRRLSKATSTMMDEEYMDEHMMAADSTTTDSVPLANKTIETDTHKPEYYLQQIPKTEADLAKSNDLLARALYNMVHIYRDQVGDQALADETFHEFCKRFPTHELLLDLYYMQYLTALKNNNYGEATQYGQDIQELFPNSREAHIVSQPNYFQQLQHMSQEQDSLYESTYSAYCSNAYNTVKENKIYAEDKYPLSPLMPRFLFLNAIAVAKTEGQDNFIYHLRDMVQRYPDNELSAMAKDMLALLGQGAESQQDDISSLGDKRQIQTENNIEDSIAVQFDHERNITSYVLLIIPQDEKQMNQLLYDIALFNFSQFMIRDFDIQLITTFAKDQSALQIAGFEKMDDAEWYANMLAKNQDLQNSFAAKGVQVICITEVNMAMLGTQFSWDDYLEWQNQ